VHNIERYTILNKTLKSTLSSDLFLWNYNTDDNPITEEDRQKKMRFYQTIQIVQQRQKYYYYFQKIKVVFILVTLFSCLEFDHIFVVIIIVV
jgi:hypothetical protein